MSKSETAPLPPMPNYHSDEDWARILDCTPAAARRAIDNLIARGLIEEIVTNAE